MDIRTVFFKYISIGTLCNRTYYCTALKYLHTEYICWKLQFLEILLAADSISKNERKPNVFCGIIQNFHDKWALITTAWRVLSLRMEGRTAMWRVTVNILNKQSRTCDKGWSSGLGVRRGAFSSLPSKTYDITKHITRP